MALNDFGRMVVFLDGNEIKVAESFDHETESGQQPVVVLNEGLVGFTPGAGQCNLGGTIYVPIGGFEDNMQAWAVEGSYHTFQTGIGANSVINRGKFTNVKLSQSTNGSAQITYQFVGDKKAFS
jgi:hypothetical protein